MIKIASFTSENEIVTINYHEPSLSEMFELKVGTTSMFLVAEEGCWAGYFKYEEAKRHYDQRIEAWEKKKMNMGGAIELLLPTSKDREVLSDAVEGIMRNLFVNDLKS